MEICTQNFIEKHNPQFSLDNCFSCVVFTSLLIGIGRKITSFFFPFFHRFVYSSSTVSDILLFVVEVIFLNSFSYLDKQLPKSLDVLLSIVIG